MQKLISNILQVINDTLSFDINNGIVGKEALADKICEMVGKKESPKISEIISELNEIAKENGLKLCSANDYSRAVQLMHEKHIKIA